MGALFVAVAVAGLALGSFASALSWRLPRGKGFVTGRSACISCGTALGARDLVPLFSWLFLRGRCRHCGAKQGLRYPLIELSTMVLCLCAAGFAGFTAALAPLMLLAAASVAIVDIDLHHKIIPDVLNAAVALAGFWFACIAGMPVAGLAGAVIYGLGAFALRQVFLWVTGREALGLGDVKFFAASGLWLGTSAASAAVYLLGAGAGGIILAIVWRRISGEKEFPFGPALVAGLWLALAGQ